MLRSVYSLQGHDCCAACCHRNWLRRGLARSEFVPKVAKLIFAVSESCGRLCCCLEIALHHANDRPPERRLGDEYLYSVVRRIVHVEQIRTSLQQTQRPKWLPATKKDDEQVADPDRGDVARGEFIEISGVPGTFGRRSAQHLQIGEPKLEFGSCAIEHLYDVVDCLTLVHATDNDVHVVGLLKRYRAEIHLAHSLATRRIRFDEERSQVKCHLVAS